MTMLCPLSTIQATRFLGLQHQHILRQVEIYVMRIGYSPRVFPLVSGSVDVTGREWFEYQLLW